MCRPSSLNNKNGVLLILLPCVNRSAASVKDVDGCGASLNELPPVSRSRGVHAHLGRVLKALMDDLFENRLIALASLRGEALRGVEIALRKA